ncbi:MAG: hypothetical protein MJZ25_12165 [Fibrobacter sp.]|nr:hypothetical protein [Fibrobacter sp.]
MLIEIMSAEVYNMHACFVPVTLNLDHIIFFYLRKARSSGGLNPDAFPAIIYQDIQGSEYKELFENDELAFNRYREIQDAYECANPILLMDESHKKESFRTYLELFGGTIFDQLGAVIDVYNQRLLSQGDEDSTPVNVQLENFLEIRRKAKETKAL